MSAFRPNLPRLLSLARWAPSGDNTQPWRFEVLSDQVIRVHGHDTRDWCLYDRQGRASLMAQGALLETLRMAATEQGCVAHWRRLPQAGAAAAVFDVTLQPQAGLAPDALLPFIERRTVQRRPMRFKPLSAAQRDALTQAAGPGYRVQWFESWSSRRQIASLMARCARLCCASPEAYQVHQRVIAWRVRFSEDRVPEHAVGVDPITARLMEWVMARWARVHFFNRFLGGTLIPSLELQWWPGLACAAHLLIQADPLQSHLADPVNVGVAVQRVWLTATAQGLGLQPETVPLIVREQVRAGVRMFQSDAAQRAAQRLVKEIEHGLGLQAAAAPQAQAQAVPVFLCRVGLGSTPHARSLRLPVDALMVGPRVA